MRLYNYNLSLKNHWLTLTVIIILLMKLRQSLERNLEAQNFKAERNPENHLAQPLSTFSRKRSWGPGVSLLLAEFKKKITQRRT